MGINLKCMDYVRLVKLLKNHFQLYVAVGIGGMIGSVVRYVVSLLFRTDNFASFPWATFLVNISGAFFLTFLLFLPVIKTRLKEPLFIGLTTGVIGSYTTFSTIIVEVVAVWNESNFIAVLYILLTIFVGLLFSYAGYALARKLQKEVRER